MITWVHWTDCTHVHARVPASTYHCGFCISFCYFSIFPLIFNVFILVAGNYSSESADADVPLGRDTGLGQPNIFVWACKKMFCPLPSNPKNIPGFSDNILKRSTDIDFHVDEWPDTSKYYLFSMTSGSLEAIWVLPIPIKKDFSYLSSIPTVSLRFTDNILEINKFGKTSKQGMRVQTRTDWHNGGALIAFQKTVNEMGKE